MIGDKALGPTPTNRWLEGTAGIPLWNSLIVESSFVSQLSFDIRDAVILGSRF